MICKAVLSRVLSWHPDIIDDQKFCPAHGILLQSDSNAEDKPLCACPVYQYRNFQDQNIVNKLNKAILEISNLMNFKKANVQNYVYEYLHSDHIYAPTSRISLPRVNSDRKLGLFYVIECLDFIDSERQSGKNVSYAQLSRRLATDARVSLSLEDSPPIDVSEDVIRLTLEKMGHSAHAKMHRVGNIGSL